MSSSTSSTIFQLPRSTPTGGRSGPGGAFSPTDQLCVALTSTADRATIALDGMLLEPASVAIETLFDQLTSTGVEGVVIDVSGVAGVDESGAVALVQLWARLRNDGVFCRIRGLHPLFADSPIELLLFVRGGGPDAFSRLLHPVPSPS